MAQVTALALKWNEPSIQKGQQPYCLHDSIMKISRIELTDVNHLSNKVENTCSDIQGRIAGLIIDAKNTANASSLSEETVNTVAQFHGNVLKKLSTIETMRLEINRQIESETADMKTLVQCINDFIECTNATSVGIRRIEAESITNIPIPGQYNGKDFFERLSSYNKLELTTGVLAAGGFILSAMSPFSKASKAVGVVTGILAIGAAMLETMAKNKAIKEECRKLVESMEENASAITDNINYLKAGVEKIRSMVSVKKATLEYFNLVISGVGDSDWLYMPHATAAHYWNLRLPDDAVDSLVKICDTFQNVAERRYVAQRKVGANGQPSIGQDRSAGMSSSALPAPDDIGQAGFWDGINLGDSLSTAIKKSKNGAKQVEPAIYQLLGGNYIFDSRNIMVLDDKVEGLLAVKYFSCQMTRKELVDAMSSMLPFVKETLFGNRSMTLLNMYADDSSLTGDDDFVEALQQGELTYGYWPSDGSPSPFFHLTADDDDPDRLIAMAAIMSETAIEAMT